MKSFSKAQAEAIADGFLDSIGTNKGDANVVGKGVVSALVRLAMTIAAQATSNLEESGKISSGELAESITVEEPKAEGSQISIEILALFYYKFIDRGVRGVESGTGDFQFRTALPSKRMVDAFDRWIKREGISVENVKQALFKKERKGMQVKSSAAYSFARSVKAKGIRPTGFMSKAIRTAETIMKKELGAGLKVDVLNTLPKKIGPS